MRTTIDMVTRHDTILSDQRGVTLVEIIVAGTIGVLVAGAIFLFARIFRQRDAADPDPADA